MVSTTHLEPVAKTFLLISNVLSNVKIENLVVPEVVATDGVAVLECFFSGAGDVVTVVWRHEGQPVFRWSSGSEPEVSGVLEGRLDLSYTRASATHVALRVTAVPLELSGEHACEVRAPHQTARAAANITVYSPEREFELTFNYTGDTNVVNIKCVARHLHPQPDLVIEYNKASIPQQQRTWREGLYYEAESRATLALPAPRPARPQLACRLHLPAVDYTAITSKYLYHGNRDNSAHIPAPISYVLLLIFMSQW